MARCGHDLALLVRELVRQICTTFEIRIVKGVVSKDHVHILVSAPPTMTPSEIMRRRKGNTSSRLFEEFQHLKKRYWGRHFWARGYFCATAGQMTEEMIKNYLEHHFEPNPNDDFKTEPYQDASFRRREYQDFQSIIQTHQLQLVVVWFLADSDLKLNTSC